MLHGPNKHAATYQTNCSFQVDFTLEVEIQPLSGLRINLLQPQGDQKWSGLNSNLFFLSQLLHIRGCDSNGKIIVLLLSLPQLILNMGFCSCLVGCILHLQASLLTFYLPEFLRKTRGTLRSIRGHFVLRPCYLPIPDLIQEIS